MSDVEKAASKLNKVMAKHIGAVDTQRVMADLIAELPEGSPKPSLLTLEDVPLSQRAPLAAMTDRNSSAAEAANRLGHQITPLSEPRD